MQISCTSLQTDNHASTSTLSFFTSRMLFPTPNQQHQSTEGNWVLQKAGMKSYLSEEIKQTLFTLDT